LTVIHKMRSGCYARRLATFGPIYPRTRLLARLPVCDLKVGMAGFFCMVLGIELKEKELAA